jgi:hypothetical protein
MVRPRWQRPLGLGLSSLGWRWDRFVAIWASINLALVVFDVTYVPLRNFWLQRHLYLFPGLPLAIPLTALPDITPLYDPVKGIEPHRDTQRYLQQWQLLDQQLLAQPATHPASRRLLQQQLLLTQQLIDDNPFLGANKTGTLERIKNRLRQRTGLDSGRLGAEQLLAPAWLQSHPWGQERLFWQGEVLPLVATNYWRSIDETGRPTERFWRLDLLVFQSVFFVDIVLRLINLRRRLPGLSWRDALLRRWTDLPLLLPFWRLARVIPVAARLRSSGLVDAEPVRAVVSRGVVALLAVELIEVLALQLLDGVQKLISSPDWSGRLRGNSTESRELEELLRLWGPLLLGRVLPRLEPELQALLSYALQRSLETSAFPQALQRLQPLLLLEREFTRQLAGGMVEGVLDLSRGTAQQLSRQDRRGSDLVQQMGEAFWRELAAAMAAGNTLERSQKLLLDLLEELKRGYLSRINSAGVDDLLEELDQLSGGSPRRVSLTSEP